MTSEAPSGRHRGRRAAILGFGILGVLLLVVGVVLGGYVYSLQNAYQKRDTISLGRGPSDGERPADGPGTNILLLGSDKRSPEEAKAAGVYGQRSDVMMLVHIPEDASEVYIMSFPRDLYVDVPGHGKDRINAALAYGGVPLAVNTVEDVVGVPIDNAALIDFEGIQGLVDSLGGVDVQVPMDFSANGTQFSKGTQHMDGETALVFVRQRKQFADGDFQRNRNQQAVLKGIIEKLIDRGTLTNPSALQDAVEAISPYMTTDDGLTSGRIAELAWSSRDTRGSDLKFMSVPHGDPMTTSGGASVVASDDEGMEVLRTALRDGTMDDYYSENAQS